MKIKKQIPRLLSGLLSLSILFGSVIPAYAAENPVADNLLEEIDLNGTEPDGAGLDKTESNKTGLDEEKLDEAGLDEMELDETESNEAELNEEELDETGLDETELNDIQWNRSSEENLMVPDEAVEVLSGSDSRYETVEVGYSQSSSYFVTIPKAITLGSDKRSPYSVKVEGDIVADKQVCVVPVDGIDETEVFDFYMSDQTAGSTKADVAAEVSQSKFYWNHEEAAAGYEETDNYILAEGLSAGRWKGTFQFDINMRTDPSHIHNYVGEVTKEPTCTEAGEKTYTCDCGDSYTETIDPTGHHYVNGECEHCGEKDPDHEHNYTETITKEPTCTEEGERTYTCGCGDTYTEAIPATGHNYVDGTCTVCGEKDPDYHEHSYTGTITKEPTCTEAGEKTYTCECGDSYTEAIPATGHHYVGGTCTNCGEEDPCAKSHVDEDGDDVCDRCGHKHAWEENTDSLAWVMTGGQRVTKSGNSYTLNYGAYNYASANWTITVPEDMEYVISYQYKYNGTSDYFMISLDGEQVLRKDAVIMFAPVTHTITLTAGTHTINGYVYRGASSSAGSSSGGFAIMTLNPINTHNHKCNECEMKENHYYKETIIEPASCTEKGKKELTCVKCGFSYIEEIEALGHHFTDGVCDKCGSLNLVSKPFWSAAASTSTTANSGAHYDRTDLAGTYSPNIEIAENMVEGEYLLLDFYVGLPFSGSGNTSEADGVNGSSMLQKYNEETGTWETVYSYGLAYGTIGSNMLSQEGGYGTSGSGSGIKRSFQLEKGTYRVYGRFSAGRGCGSATAHRFYSYRIEAEICQIEKGETAENL